jgi:hypothetical protein
MVRDELILGRDITAELAAPVQCTGKGCRLE